MRRIIVTVLLLALAFPLVPKAVDISVLEDKNSAEDFLDSYVCENVSFSEWFVFALAESGCNFNNYVNALDEYLSDNEPSSVTSLKYALVYKALGCENDYTQKISEELSVQNGIMYSVFSLHLLNNGAICTSLSKDDAVDFILQQQNGDGGWSVVKSEYSDADVTAMVLQSLAVHKEKANDAINEALVFLSSSQTENGGFKSYGKENAESASQVIIALSSLQIDAKTDERFIKNGKTAFDSLETFRTDDGYSHLHGGKTNDVTTSQAFCAYAAYEKYSSSGKPFYIFEKKAEEIPQKTDTSPLTDTSDGVSQNVDTKDEKSNIPLWRIVFICAVSVFGMIFCIILTLRKHGNIKNYLFVAALCVLLIVLSFLINFSSPDSYYSDTVPDEKVTGSVMLSISAETIGEGDIISNVSIPIHENDTAYDVLISCAKLHKLVIGKSGTGEYAYIQSINGISEKQHGELSGWIYTVNGEIPSEGCGAYSVKDGDTVQFIYSTDGKLQ